MAYAHLRHATPSPGGLLRRMLKPPPCWRTRPRVSIPPIAAPRSSLALHRWWACAQLPPQPTSCKGPSPALEHFFSCVCAAPPFGNSSSPLLVLSYAQAPISTPAIVEKGLYRLFCNPTKSAHQSLPDDWLYRPTQARVSICNRRGKSALLFPFVSKRLLLSAQFKENNRLYDHLPRGELWCHALRRLGHSAVDFTQHTAL